MQKESASLNMTTAPADSTIVRWHPSLPILILCIPIFLAYISIAIQNWNIVFDDAYISYRYARNLAMGYGITWNAGFPATEGYTNFLLVLILAPIIKAGLDPLLFTRVLSLFCAMGMAYVLFVFSRRQFGCSTTASSMVAALIFLVPATEVLCLVGMETVIYAFFLLITFFAGAIYIERKQSKHSIIFSCILFLTMLLRPEAALLYPIMSITFLIESARHKSGLKSLMIGFLVLLALGGAYLAWKYYYFGQILPNPFYLKAVGNSFISPDGLQSVLSYINEYSLLLLLAFPGMFLAIVSKGPERHLNKIIALTGFSFIFAYCIFFIHIDTLMDIYGRFLYPLVPLLILLTIPFFAKALGFIESISKHKAIVLSVLMVVYLLAFAPADIFKFYERLTWLSSKHNLQANKFYMVKELHIAKVLARFPHIKDTRIAFADSGVIPYFSGAIWLDVVGLNDSYIAKTRDKNKLVDYFFAWSPDLVIHPGKAGYSWLQDGHGPLGDYLSWSNDPRWDDYEYVGTSKMDDISYDLQYFVKKSSRFRGDLDSFLKTNIVDGWYDPFPLPIGTYNPNGTRSTWRSR